jgi:hypothetical protein
MEAQGVSDRSSSERLAANERVNAMSRFFMNLGTALFAATSARVYFAGGIDGAAVLWLSGVILLMFCGLKLLDLLDAETNE